MAPAKRNGFLQKKKPDEKLKLVVATVNCGVRRSK